MKRVEKFIAQVREKPEHIRLRYVLGFTVLGMLIMIGVWILSFGQSFKAIKESVNDIGKAEENIKKSGDELEGSIQSLMKEFESQSQETQTLQQEQIIPSEQSQRENENQGDVYEEDGQDREKIYNTQSYK